MMSVDLYRCDETPWPRRLTEERVYLGFIVSEAESTIIGNIAADRQAGRQAGMVLEQ